MNQRAHEIAVGWLWWMLSRIARGPLALLEAVNLACWKACRYDLLDQSDKVGRLHRFLCMWNGHAGVVWYTSCGYEPDMHCKRCGEDLA